MFRKFWRHLGLGPLLLLGRVGALLVGVYEGLLGRVDLPRGGVPSLGGRTVTSLGRGRITSLLLRRGVVTSLVRHPGRVTSLSGKII